MSIDRPTFSDSWYRVAQLRPRLRAAVQTHRQHFRGQTWHVLRDLGNDQYFRLSEPAYRFIGMLDGNRSVAEVWAAANEQLGDRAPTQGEAIQLLGQLFTSNLLQCELPADSAGMFERYRKRVRREVGGYLMNLLFMRIPLFDPEPILEKWVHLVGWLFSLPGLLLWALYVGFGFSYLTGHWEELFKAAQPQTLLQTENIFLLYACFAGIKAIHEFGHGFACKRFGKVSGTGGEVHTMGIMLLVMAPVPYVDASSAWAFRNKWHRIIVGAGGMYVELLVAATAAIIWANTAPGTLINDICFNLIFIASVSTIMFNANPLLRYDGYYMLSDALEIPNLGARANQYLGYLFQLEYPPIQVGPAFLEGLTRCGIPREAMTFLAEHATADVAHCKLMEQYCEKLIGTEEDLSAALYMQDLTAELYRRMLEEACASAERWQDLSPANPEEGSDPRRLAPLLASAS